jgi:hypothetical protein
VHVAIGEEPNTAASVAELREKLEAQHQLLLAREAELATKEAELRELRRGGPPTGAVGDP